MSIGKGRREGVSWHICRLSSSVCSTSRHFRRSFSWRFSSRNSLSRQRWFRSCCVADDDDPNISQNTQQLRRGQTRKKHRALCGYVDRKRRGGTGLKKRAGCGAPSVRLLFSFVFRPPFFSSIAFQPCFLSTFFCLISPTAQKAATPAVDGPLFSLSKWSPPFNAQKQQSFLSSSRCSPAKSATDRKKTKRIYFPSFNQMTQ